MQRPNDIWLPLIGIPLLVLISNLPLLQGSGYSGWAYVGYSLLCTTYGLLVWEGCVRWLMYIRSRYADITQTRRRVLTTFAGYLLIAIPLHSLFIRGSAMVNFVPGWYAPQSAYLFTSVGVLIVMLVGAVFEIGYFLKKYREAVQESEAIKQSGLKIQFDTLRAQVNPHFLFNSLNTLSALIAEDQSRAGLFLDEMATVYRYLLQTNQQHLVPLKTELSFIRSFLYLLKTRFGAAFDYDIQIQTTLLDRLIPPLTLQTLVENAIRHNVVEADQPLFIGIETIDGCLMVTNTIQRKTRLLETQPGGLSHLTVRYQTLKLPLPRITDNGQLFSVWLPLGTRSV